MNSIEELDAFAHGALERFAAGDQTGTARTLDDDGGGYGFFEVVRAGGAAAVDQTDASRVAVYDLITA